MNEPWWEIMEREKYGVYFEGGYWNATTTVQDYEWEGYWIEPGPWAPTPGEAILKLFAQQQKEKKGCPCDRQA